MASNDSCTQWEDQNSLSSYVFGEDQVDYLEENREPGIVAVFNGKMLNIKEELIKEALSGISVKHYDGNCLPPEEPFSDEYLLGEDGMTFNYNEEEEKNLSRTMSSMIRLCYQPKNKISALSNNMQEGSSDFLESPLCLQEQINFRNSFWDLHRPELCKLTWPYAYVGEATVTEHLHRHVKKHGEICSKFHDPRDMVAMLDKELDVYDKLKTIQSPREIPPDEEMFFHLAEKNQKPRKMKFNPCNKILLKSSFKETNDDDLEKSQMLHSCNEEFCITIGRPIRKRPIRDKHCEINQVWAPNEEQFQKVEEYVYPGESCYSTVSYDACESNYDVELKEAEETLSEETTPPKTAGWVEPDYCAMI